MQERSEQGALVTGALTWCWTGPNQCENATESWAVTWSRHPEREKGACAEPSPFINLLTLNRPQCCAYIFLQRPCIQVFPSISLLFISSFHNILSRNFFTSYKVFAAPNFERWLNEIFVYLFIALFIAQQCFTAWNLIVDCKNVVILSVKEKLRNAIVAHEFPPITDLLFFRRWSQQYVPISKTRTATLDSLSAAMIRTIPNNNCTPRPSRTPLFGRIWTASWARDFALVHSSKIDAGHNKDRVMNIWEHATSLRNSISAGDLSVR